MKIERYICVFLFLCPAVVVTASACTDEDNGDTPGTYVWHTFYGSAEFENGSDLVADESGNLYIAGTSPLSWDGPNGQKPLNPHSTAGDPEMMVGNLFVLKLNADGEYQWHTFLFGGYDVMFVNAIARDNLGNIYVAGSSIYWKGPQGQEPLHPHADQTLSTDIFVLKLNSDGQYQWHTFYGGTSYEMSWSMTVDAGGNPSVSGCVGATWDGPEGEPPRRAYGGGAEDMFLLKLDTNGAYQWHAFYGGVGDYEHGFGLASDTGGNLYLAGCTDGPWNGANDEPPLNAHSETDRLDIVLVKVDPNGVYQWHTFYGTGESDCAMSVATDQLDGVYLTGDSMAAWAGPGGQQPLNAHSDTVDGEMVVVKLNAAGQYQWHTFYRGGGIEAPQTIAVGADVNIYIAGACQHDWKGPDEQEPLNPYYSGIDAFVLQLDRTGAYGWHTFYGSSDGKFEGGDWATSIGMDAEDNLYVAGQSEYLWNGPDDEQPLHPHAGLTDAFVLKLSN